MKAIHLKSFDYRVLNLLLYQLRDKQVVLMTFVSVYIFILALFTKQYWCIVYKLNTDLNVFKCVKTSLIELWFLRSYCEGWWVAYGVPFSLGVLSRDSWWSVSTFLVLFFSVFCIIMYRDVPPICRTFAMKICFYEKSVWWFWIFDIGFIWCNSDADLTMRLVESHSPGATNLLFHSCIFTCWFLRPTCRMMCSRTVSMFCACLSEYMALLPPPCWWVC